MTATSAQIHYETRAVLLLMVGKHMGRNHVQRSNMSCPSPHCPCPHLSRILQAGQTADLREYRARKRGSPVPFHVCLVMRPSLDCHC